MPDPDDGSPCVHQPMSQNDDHAGDAPENNLPLIGGAAPAAGAGNAPGRRVPGPARSPGVARRGAGALVADAVMWCVSAAIFSGIGYVGWRTAIKGEPVATVLPFMALPAAGTETAADAPASGETVAKPVSAVKPVVLSTPVPVTAGAVSALPPAYDVLAQDALPPSTRPAPATTATPPSAETAEGGAAKPAKDENVTLFGRRIPRSSN